MIVKQEKESESPWQQPSTAISILTALGGLAAVLVQRRWHRKDQAEARSSAVRERKESEDRLDRERQQMFERAERDRLLTYALDALKWFEGKSQKRSIGISIVEGHWQMFPSLQATWTAVLANQAVYLLAESGQADAAHERDNLNRIQRLLNRPEARLNDAQKEALMGAVKVNIGGGGLRGVSESEYAAWKDLADAP